ncbi:MAG: diguanylate cyclase [Desulfovibrio sp.]
MSRGAYQRISSAELLNAVARGAVELSSEHGWPDGVNTLLAGLGRVTGVSRVWIFQKLELRDQYILQDYVFEWASAPHHAQIDLPMFSMFRTERDNPEYETLIQSRLRGEIQAVIVRELPPDCWLRGNLGQQNILSMLTLPIMVDGEWWGLLGFDDCEREYVWSETEMALLRTAAGLIAGAVVRNRLSARVRQFHILQSLTDSAAWSVDLRRGRIWCSGDLAGRSDVPPEGRYFSMLGALRLIHPQDRRELLQELRAGMQARAMRLRRDVRVHHQGGEYRWVELIGELTLDGEGRPGELSGIAVDIRHRKHTERRLQHEAVTDPLTRTSNRRTFMRELDELYGQAMAGQGPLSLLLMDLDHFKRINDTWGHPVGDAMLQAFAEFCRQSLREGDVLARIGGEEFAVLLPGTDAPNAAAVGERIRSAVCAAPVRHKEFSIPLAVSLGSATVPDPLPRAPEINSAGELFSWADRALYAAKRTGRNRLVRATTDLEPPLRKI